MLLALFFAVAVLCCVCAHGHISPAFVRCQSLFPDRFEYISGPSAETVKAFGEARQGRVTTWLQRSSTHHDAVLWPCFALCQARCEMRRD